MRCATGHSRKPTAMNFPTRQNRVPRLSAMTWARRLLSEAGRCSSWSFALKRPNGFATRNRLGYPAPSTPHPPSLHGPFTQRQWISWRAAAASRRRHTSSILTGFLSAIAAVSSMRLLVVSGSSPPLISHQRASPHPRCGVPFDLQSPPARARARLRRARNFASPVSAHSKISNVRQPIARNSSTASSSRARLRAIFLRQ